MANYNVADSKLYTNTPISHFNCQPTKRPVSQPDGKLFHIHGSITWPNIELILRKRQSWDHNSKIKNWFFFSSTGIWTMVPTLKPKASVLPISYTNWFTFRHQSIFSRAHKFKINSKFCRFCVKSASYWICFLSFN